MFNDQDKYLAKYLEKYSEPEVSYAPTLGPLDSCRHVIVVPAYAESPDFLATLQSRCQTAKALAIVVINQPRSIETCRENAELWQSIRDNFSALGQSENLSLFDWGKDSQLLVVDRFSANKTINDKQGVGLARKIGCDIAVALIQQHRLQTHWIHTTDADTELPEDYFSRISPIGPASAAVYPFIHRGTDVAVTAATHVYEQSLRYYVAGLRWAQSPYAFHTIGSCIAISATHYCQARGFPKRAGGEDFYLLNKLAKLAPVIALSGAPIEIQSRRSLRAPFGTGPAVEKLLALNELQNYPGYDPRVFIELKTLLAHLAQWWTLQLGDEAWLQHLPTSTQQACRDIGLARLFVHLRKQCRNQDDARYHIQRWFDGFRTLKFIHLLQGTTYPPVPLHLALARAQQLFKPWGDRYE